MSFFLSPEATARQMYRWHWLFLAGVAVLAFACTNRPYVGIPTGWMLLTYGAFAAGFRGRYREPGYWMMGGLMLAFFVPLFVGLQVYAFNQHRQQQRPLGWAFALDASVAAAVVLHGVRFLLSATRLNRQLSRAAARP